MAMMSDNAGAAANTELDVVHHTARQHVLNDCSITPEQASHVIISIPADKYIDPGEPEDPSTQSAVQPSLTHLPQQIQQQLADMQPSMSQYATDTGDRTVHISVMPTGTIRISSKGVALNVQHEPQAASHSSI